MSKSDQRLFEFLRSYRGRVWHVGWQSILGSGPHTVICGDGTLAGSVQKRRAIPEGGRLCAECRKELERRCRVKIEEVA